MALTDEQKKHYEAMRKRDLLRADRLRKSRLTSDVASVSSNSKWEKIFDSLQAQLSSNTKCIVKLLKQEEPWEYQNILSSVFEETYFDGMSGPLRYSEIEWLELECETEPSFDFKVDIEVGDGVIVVYGYRARHS